ncbi:MAG: hypothetical protein JNK32_04325, partial [Anaerolineales bacterium]|nr:hypothetical protein [Anaerolineales bacterium]
AESLANGQGYELINFPRPQIERNFPPGWPLLLAPFTVILPKNYDALKVVSLVLWLASIFLVYKLFSKRLASPYLEMLTALVALNPLLVGSSVTVMSESAYGFFSLLALVVFDKTDGKRISWVVLAALLALYTQQIRTIGIALTISLLVILLFSRRFKDLGIVSALFIVGFMFQAGINLRNGGTVISSGYEAQVLSGSVMVKISQVWSNASGYFDTVLTGALIPIFGTRLGEMFGGVFIIINILILAILLIGFFAVKPKLEWMQIYFIIYMLGILAFWNPQVGSVKTRFLIPILPMLYFYFLCGLTWLANKISPRLTARIIFGVSGLIALVLLARNLQDWRSPIHEQMTDLSIGTSWVAENAPEDSIVMVNEPVPAYVHVKRKTIGFPKNGQDLEKYLQNQGIDYIVVSPLLQSPRSTELSEAVKEEILPILISSPGKFMVVYDNPDYNVTVYQYLNTSQP